MGKLVSEILINEFTRRGFVDGRILRLPTIVVRPGVPSAATSAFLSGDYGGMMYRINTTCTRLVRYYSRTSERSRSPLPCRRFL